MNEASILIGARVQYRQASGVHTNLALLDGDTPCGATIAYVSPDGAVSLDVVDHRGQHHALEGVQLVNEGDEIPESGSFAYWPNEPWKMPDVEPVKVLKAPAKKAAAKKTAKKR